MPSRSDKLNNGNRWPWVLAAGFWGAYAACLILWVQPELLYTAFGRLLPYPDFELTVNFAFQSLNHPGGVAETLCGLLSQGLAVPWMAAAVITAVAFIVSAGMGQLLGAASQSARAIGEYVPALMILMAYARFSHPMTSCLSLAISLWAVALVRRLRFRRAGLDWALGVGVRPVAGDGQRAAQGDCHRPDAAWIDGRDCDGLGMGLGDWPAAKALLYPMPFGPGWGLNFRNVPLIAIQIVWLWPIVMGLMDLLADIAISRNNKSKLTHSAPVLQSWKRALVPGLLLGAAVPLSVLASYDPVSARQLRIIYLGHQQRWTKLLDCAGDLPPNAYNLYLNHEIDRALAHTDQMGERLFAYPQSPLLSVFGGKITTWDA